MESIVSPKMLRLLALSYKAVDDISRTRVEINGVYRHYKGGLYRVVCKACQESDGVEQVVYRPENGGHYWVRPLKEFVQKFERVELESLKSKSLIEICSKLDQDGRNKAHYQFAPYSVGHKK